MIRVKLAPGRMLKKWAGLSGPEAKRVLIIATQMGVVTMGFRVRSPAMRLRSLGLLTTR